MKKILLIATSIVLLIIMSGCGDNIKLSKKIDADSIKTIAEFSTVEGVYHNVATYDQDMNNPWFKFWKKGKKKFWCEYEGTVTVGFDANKMSIDIGSKETEAAETIITIAMPKPKITDTNVNEDSIKLFFDNESQKIAGEEERQAIEAAQKEMRSKAKKDDALESRAINNAKSNIEQFVDKMNELTDSTEYKIIWNDVIE